MKHTIICIGRQYGSGGREISEKLAAELGVVCYDKLLVRQTAKELGLPVETVEQSDERPIGLGAMISGNWLADSAALQKAFYSEEQRIFEAERRTILELAEREDCVIVGRCASSILREEGYPVLSVFIYADADDRIARVAERNGLDERAARHHAKRVDRMRKLHFDFYSDTAWGEPESYDLMLSSSRYGVDGAVALIKAALEKEKENG